VEPHAGARAATLDALARLGLRATTAIDTDAALAQLAQLAAFGQWARPGAGTACDVVIYSEPSHPGRESPFAQRMRALSVGGLPRLVKLVPMSTLAELDIHAVQGVHGWCPKPVTETALRSALLEMHQEAVEGASAVESGFAPLPTLNARVLLVEDNPINAEIALELLSDIGCSVTRAASGEEALAEYGRQSFDAILMDCQMPGMDGFEATRRIRAAEADRDGRNPGAGGRTPIIALTANALSGDRERCIAAGMDDHLGKPFRRAQLRSIMGRWIALQSGQAPLSAAEGGVRRDPPQPPIAAAAPVEVPAIDRHALLERLQVGGRTRPALVARVIGLYLDDTPALLRAITEGIAGDDRPAIERAAHTLKSSSASVGAVALASLAADVEAHARRAPPAVLQAQGTEMLRHFVTAAGQLGALRDELQAPAGGETAP